MSNFRDRTVVRMETRVIDFSNLNDHMKNLMHEKLVCAGYTREHPAVDTAGASLGSNRVTYKRWLENSE